MQSPASSSSKTALTSKEAAALLGVKAQTLYAYASRGLLRRIGSGKQRRYLLEDVTRLQLRQRARSGHGPVAGAALSFGEPVLDTRITAIDERGPLYRGHAATELAERGVPFEAVAELLWSGELPQQTPVWSRPAAVKGGTKASLEELLASVPALLAASPERHLRSAEAEVELGRRCIRVLAELLVSERARGRSGSIADLLVERCARVERKAARESLNLALVLLADHELNASSFAARVAASTDANLVCCITAALATLSGPRHGGACDRVEALLEEAQSLPRPSEVIERRSRRGEAVPGFGHPLYPHGDPRAPSLLERAQKLARRTPRARQRVEAALQLSRAMARQGLPATVDFGLVALTRALGMPAGSAALLFALGRSAGWVAHVLEQRGSEAVLRPRARYAGPSPRALPA